MATSAPRRPTKDAVAQLAPMIVGTTNFCVVTTFGTECGLTEMEVKLLIPSLQRTLERMPASAATRGALIIDPLVMLTVLVMWGKRIASIKDREAKEKYLIKPAEKMRADGVSGFSDSPITTEKETANGIHAAEREDYVNGVPVATNGHVNYGTPPDIRESIDERI